MANGVWEMYKVNQMKGIRGRLQGDNNLEEANESNQWQHGYKGYIQMKGIRGRLQGDNNLEEANESNQWQHGYKGYIQGLLDIYALA
jgi:hypothetical protein